MGFGFGLAQNGKDAHRNAAGIVRQIGMFQNMQHIPQLAVLVMMVMFMRVVVLLMAVHVVVAVLGIMVMMVLFVAVQVFPIVHMGFMGMVILMVVVMLVFVVMFFLVGVAIQVFHVMVVVFVLFVQQHIKIAGIQPGFFHAGDLHFNAVHRQAGKGLFQHSFVSAKVQQSRRYHIAADAGIAFQV